MSYNRDSDEEFNKCLTVYGDNKMTDAEQIEAWRSEHKSILLATNRWCLANFQEIDGSYYDWHLQASWEGFLMAKRSQPVIELPKPTAIDFGTLNSINSIDCLSIYSIGEAITSAGYRYKVKS